jgi:uncharacterized protein YcbK (DUF882 family)
MNWDNYPNFSKEELMCKHCGDCHMDESFMDMLQTLRIEYDRPMVITSGYRCPEHPIEAKKDSGTPGAHTSGKAVDIGVRGTQAYELLDIVFAMGFTGIGVSQKGDVRFIHIDTLDGSDRLRPTIWSY